MSARTRHSACNLFRTEVLKGDKALVDIQLFKSKTFSASAITQLMSNGISFGPDADSDLSNPRLWSIAGRATLAACSSWARNDLSLSMDGSVDAAVRYTKSFCWRSASSFRRHAAVSLSGQSRIWQLFFCCAHCMRSCLLQS
jgi:hypothetical protein